MPPYNVGYIPSAMKLFSSLQEASDGSLKGCAICLGNFDGVHLGHQALFAEAAKHGSLVALTFQPHPGKVLQPQLAPRLIVSQARKLELLEAHGVEAVIVQPFSTEYARTTPEAFEALYSPVKRSLLCCPAAANRKSIRNCLLCYRSVNILPTTSLWLPKHRDWMIVFTHRL